MTAGRDWLTVTGSSNFTSGRVRPVSQGPEQYLTSMTDCGAGKSTVNGRILRALADHQSRPFRVTLSRMPWTKRSEKLGDASLATKVCRCLSSRGEIDRLG